MATRSHRIDAYIKTMRPLFERTLGEMVEIPSISMDPQRKHDVQSWGQASGGMKAFAAYFSELAKMP